MRLSFIQLTAFRAAWRRVGLTDEDLQALEMAILGDPSRPPVLRGTGGLRKVRFASGRTDGGKSGGLRVCYAYFPAFGLVYLCAVFAKSDQANLTVAQRNAYRQVLVQFEQYLREHAPSGRTP